MGTSGTGTGRPPQGRVSASPPTARHPAGQKPGGQRAPVRKPGDQPAPARSNSRTAPRQAPRQAPRRKTNYAARRLIALAVVFLVVGAGVLAAMSTFNWFQRKLAEPIVQPTTAASAINTAQPTACPPESLVWTVVPTAGRAGDPVDFQWSVTNNSEENCTIDAAPTSVVFSIISGNDPIWSSAHCGAPDPLLLLLGPEDQTSRLTRWSGERSQEGCTPVGANVRPGTYHVSITYEGFIATGAAAVFSLGG